MVKDNFFRSTNMLWVILILLLVLAVFVVYLNKKGESKPQRLTAAEFFNGYKNNPALFEKTNINQRFIIEGIADSFAIDGNNQTVYMFLDYDSGTLRGIKIEMTEIQDIDDLMGIVSEGIYSGRDNQWLVFRKGKVLEKNNE